MRGNISRVLNIIGTRLYAYIVMCHLIYIYRIYNIHSLTTYIIYGSMLIYYCHSMGRHNKEVEQMDEKKKGRIERYLMNASRFMWGLGPGNQKANYAWLEKEGFKFSRARYGLVTHQLLRYPGIEKLLNKLIIPAVKERFPEDTLSALKEHWYRGEWPNLSNLKGMDVKGKGEPGADRAFHWHPFVEISTQFHYVERWGNFAGIWFEEIEPLLNEK